MRRALHRLSVGVGQGKALRLEGNAVGRQDIERVPRQELIALGDDRGFSAEVLLADRDLVVTADIAAAVNLLPRLGSEIEARAVLAVADFSSSSSIHGLSV